MIIYNSLNKKKQKFITKEKKLVKIYVCGVTVYDHCHIGHAKSFFAFDTIIRFFEYKGYKVLFVRNITDVDDKIVKKIQRKEYRNEKYNKNLYIFYERWYGKIRFN